MQRSTSNSDFSVPVVEHVLFQTMKIYICTMIDRRNQPRAENVFRVRKVLTKLQSLQLESMRRNFHVKLPYITIDREDILVHRARTVWTKISKLQQPNDIGLETYIFMFRDVCHVRFVIPMQNLSRDFLYPPSLPQSLGKIFSQ